MIRTVTALTFVSLVFTSACKTDNGQDLYPNPVACDTANMKYGANIAPILARNCTDQGCHTTGKPDGGYELESYSGVSVAASSKLVNALKYVNSPSKNMPPTGKLSDCDIAKVEAWVKRGYPNN